MEKLPILIHRFYTVYEDDPKKPGSQRARDMVEYGPIGQAGRTHTTERIDILSKPQKIAGANPAVTAARVMWAFIQPRYEAWKNNQDLPETGTPLAAWNHLTQSQAEILRVNGVRSVEDVAQLTDTHFHRIPIPNLRSFVDAAKKFLDSKDVNAFTAQMEAKDEQLAAANARIDQMAEMLAKFMEEKGGDPPKRGPGRPPKTEQAAA
jgi:hypothetical protein